MRDYKTEMAQEQHEEQLRPTIAKALGITENELAQCPYDRDGNQILWLERVPDGVEAKQRITELTLFQD